MTKAKAEKRKKRTALISAIIGAAVLVLAVIAIVIYKNGGNGLFSACVPAEETVYEPLPTPRKGELCVYTLDVGQGDASIVVSPNGKTMLVDSGDYLYTGRLFRAMRELELTGFDVVIATHPHSDHIGGMPSIINQTKIGQYFTCEAPEDSPSAELTSAALEEKGITPVMVWSGDTIEWDKDCTVTILSPVLGCEYSQIDANDWSIIFRIEYKDNAVIFTGDATVHAEQLSMFHNERDLFSADVLKVPHHGSTTSSSYGFLEAVGGEYAIISVGATNPYGHPDFDILNRLNGTGYTVLRTDTCGSITAFMDGEKVTVEYRTMPSAEQKGANACIALNAK